MILHERLTRLISELRVNAATAARRLHVSEPTMSAWLRGKAECREPYLARLVEMRDGERDAKMRTLAELLLLRARLRVEKEDDGRWTPPSRALALETVDDLLRRLPAETTRTGPRTLADFPSAFYPLAVVTGDKREDSESRINAADFGAVSASPAETRWLPKLGLRSDVELLTDKQFVIDPVDKLRERFGKMNLLVVEKSGQ